MSTKPDQTKGPKTSTLLIPESVLDIASQRVFVISAFILIQSWKIYDLFLIKNDSLREMLNSNSPTSIFSPEFNFLLKYFFLDGLIIWITSVLKLPKLSFKLSTTLLFLIAMFTSTILLTADIKLPILSILLSIWKQLFPEKELSLTESYVDPYALLDQSSHFKGKKVVRFAPDSSIKINPFGNTYCFKTGSTKKINIPIKLESLNDLDFLQVSHRDLNNENTILNYTSKEIHKFLKGDYSEYAKMDNSFDDDKTRFLELPIFKPGSYSIYSSLDKKQKNIRSYKSDLIVPVCPDAKFISSESITEKCIDDELDSLAITVIGVPPFTLYYEEEVNGVLSHLPQSIIVPEDEDFKSPLLSKDLYTGKSNVKRTNYQVSDLRDITWAKTRVINVPIGKKRIEKSGEYIYTINKVIDGFGNTVEFIPNPSDEHTFIKFKSHPLPMISLVDSRPNVPILLGQKKFIDVKLSHVPCISCESPYNAVFKYTPAESEGEEEVFSRSFDFKTTQPRIPVEKPGVYTIETASSKYCNCKIGSSSVSVLEAKLPQVQIAADPIIDNCVGTTGFKFDFEFIGTAPFEVTYKVSTLDPNNPKRVLATKQVKSLHSDSTVLEFNYKPPTEGSYSIEFLSLSDKYYKNKVQFSNNEHRYVTYFKQRPRAYFNKNSNVQRINVCNGGDAEVTLFLEGKAPFKFSYDLVSPSYEAQTFSFEDIYDHQFTLKTGTLNRGGDYVLTLRDVTDASNCGVDFKSQEVHIEVRKDIPQLSFVKAHEYTIVQGKKLLVPLRTESTDPIDLQYKYRSLDGSKEEIKSISRFNPTVGLPIYDEGYYDLVSFKQGGCPGKIARDFEVKVSYVEKPTLQLIPKDGKISTEHGKLFIKDPLCEQLPGSIDFQAVGIAPFVIEYSIKYPSGLIEEKSELVSNKNFAIQLKTSESGNYEYNIKGIYDSVYTTSILKDLLRKGSYIFDQYIIQHKVSSLPNAKLSNAGADFQTCISSLKDINKLEPISLELTGKLPIDVRLSMYHDQEDRSEIITLEKIQTHSVNLYSIYENLSIGSHTISIIEVSDGNGCSNEVEKQSVTVHINDVPKIRHLVEESPALSEHQQGSDSHYYCVGEHINYLLNGIPPFTVYYDFNGNKHKVDVNSNYFKRRASKDGDLSILALSDSSSKNCLVNFTVQDTLGETVNLRNDLTAKIYDLPSVEIIQGESIEEDIYEGEQVEITFKFEGTPPFKVTYIRTDLDNSEKIVETEVIDDIRDYEYKIVANLEGAYEAIEIQDAFCVARNHHV